LTRCYFTDRSVGIPIALILPIAGVAQKLGAFHRELFVGKRVKSSSFG